MKLLLAYVAAVVVAEHTDLAGTCHAASCVDSDDVDELTFLAMDRRAMDRRALAMATETNDSAPCLCVFDIDRTFTASQKESACKHTKQTEGIQDDSYDGGEMKLSEIGEVGVAHTECSKCYVGIVSQGNASGANSSKRKYIAIDIIQTDVFREFAKTHSDALDWSDWDRNSSHPIETSSPLILRCLNAMKPDGVSAILKWYAARGLNISNEDTYFFDDRTGNIQYFAGKGFNAHQISCSTRGRASDSGDKIGKCGAQLSEIRLQKGHTLCSSDVPN